MIYTATIKGWDPAAAAEATLRFASGLGYAHPLAGGYHDPRLIQPANLTRAMFESLADGGATIGGPVGAGFGELVLANADGALDHLVDWGFDGREIVLAIGAPDAPPATHETVLRGTVDQPEFTWAEVRFRIRDRLAEFRRPLQPTKYAGSNALPAGVEGGDDLKGQPKPLVYGRAQNMAPPCVNTARLIYQVHAGAVAAIGAVYDNGLALTAGAAYASQTDMEDNAPAAGQYRLWLAGGMFRLGSSPAGQVTADVTQGATAADRTVAQILRALATGPGGIASGDVVDADVTALDAAAGAEVGLCVDREAELLAVMSQLAQSVGAWFGFDRLGRLRMGQLAAPAGVSVATIQAARPGDVATATTVDALEIERIATRESVPAFRVTLAYAPNWTVQTDGVAGAVTAERRAFLRQAYRSVTATDATVQTKHRLAAERAAVSLIHDAAAAQAEATRLLDLFKVRRDLLRVRVAWSTAEAALLDLGAVVTLRSTRFGYAAGRQMVVVGITYDAAVRQAELVLWG